MATAREQWRNIAQIRPDETIGLVNIHNRTEVPLKSVSCHVTIRGFIADVEAILHYECEGRDESEAVFVFPLETGSVVYSFTMRVNDRLLVGECQSKYTAMRRYTDALEEGLPVAMLVLDDADVSVFRCGVGRVPPQTPIIVKLSYSQELEVRGDRGIHYTLPSLMNPAQRPAKGAFQRQWSLVGQSTLSRSTLNRTSLRPGALSSPRSLPLALDFELEVIGQHKVMAIKTPHDQLTGSFLNQEDTHVKGTLAEPFKFDHDLTLGVYYENVEAPCVTAETAVNITEDGLMDGTVVMINFAPSISDEGPVLGEIKDFVLMIDCSSDKYFERIREAIGYFVKSLPVGSYFNICTYNDNFKFLFPQGSQPHSETSLRHALSLQKSLEPNVGSFPNLHNPISHLFRRFSTPAGSQRQVIVISGGNERFTTAICKMANDNTHSTRIHTIGVSPDRSPCIVSELATAGQGTSHYVHEAACLTSKVMRCMRCAVLPCVRDLHLEWSLPDGVTVTVIPTELPTLLFGERAIIYAVLKGWVPPGFVNQVRISGVNHSLYFTHDVVFRVPEPEVAMTAAGSVEPALPLHRLMAKMWMDESYNKCYTDLPGTIAGREANVVSRFTTFVVTDKTPGRQPMPFMEHTSLENHLLPPTLRAKLRPKGSKAPIKKWLAKAGGAVFKRKAKRKQLPASELTQMVVLQRWDGSWELDKALAELLCVPLKVIRKENPYKVVQEDTPWATSLAVVWMEGFHEEKVSEWDLLADKATTFLRQRNTDSDELLRRAALLLGLQIEEIAADTYW